MDDFTKGCVTLVVIVNSIIWGIIAFHTMYPRYTPVELEKWTLYSCVSESSRRASVFCIELAKKAQ